MLFFLSYYSVTSHGESASLSQVKLLIANHVGGFEVIVLFTHCFPSFVSAIENLSYPLFTGIVKSVDAIVVDRSDKESKHTTLREIERRSADPDAPQLMIFPEGTCNNQATLFRFSKGAFSTGDPVQPVLFKFPYKHFNPCFTGRLSGGNDLDNLLYRSACQFVSRIEYKFLDVYYPSEEEKKDPELYATNVQRFMAAALGTGVSDASYEDYRLVMKAHHAEQQTQQAKQKGGWLSKRLSKTWGASSGRQKKE
eukprot:c19022_g1_i2.p1 GENE.c19022_g1_i2~~c19022_g1_i2.p1  ORF type:complete len:253 (+),score=69.61 c19022_g1_i2:144-902(+)